MSVDLSPSVAVPPGTPNLVSNPKSVEPKSVQTLAALQEKKRMVIRIQQIQNERNVSYKYGKESQKLVHRDETMKSGSRD